MSDIPSWEEWNSGLSEEQRKYSLYKILKSLDTKTNNMSMMCGHRKELCDDDYAKKDDVRWLSWGIRAIYGGGVLLIIIYAVKDMIGA